MPLAKQKKHGRREIMKALLDKYNVNVKACLNTPRIAMLKSITESVFNKCYVVLT